MTCKKLNTMLVYFQHTPKNYIQDIFSLNFMLPDDPLFKLPHTFSIVLAKRYSKSSSLHVCGCRTSLERTVGLFVLFLTATEK